MLDNRCAGHVAILETLQKSRKEEKILQIEQRFKALVQEGL